MLFELIKFFHNSFLFIRFESNISKSFNVSRINFIQVVCELFYQEEIFKLKYYLVKLK